jgi:hypothetical protein
MRTVYGIVVDELGIAATDVLEGGEARVRAWETPASRIAPVQESPLPIDRNHDGVAVGQVVYLERQRGGLWAIGHVSDEVGPFVLVDVAGESVPVETPLYWSATRSNPALGDEIDLYGLSLTPSPCQTAAKPVRFQDGQLRDRSSWLIDSFERGLLGRAYEYDMRRRHRDPLRVHGHVDPDAPPLPPGLRVSNNRAEPEALRQAGGRGSILSVS